MRYSPDAIRRFLSEQAASDRSVASFCKERQLKVSTFYAWRHKYRTASAEKPAGFCQIVARTQRATKSVRLPSGLELDLNGMTLPELADLLILIDQSYA